jgi:CRP-like cAMP-binding protein
VDKIVEAFRGPVMVSKGTVLIRQGESIGSRDPALFILEGGSAEIFIRKTPDTPRPGKLVFSLNQPGQVFGHIAVLYETKRTATVTASSECSLWFMDRDTFQWGLDYTSIQEIVAIQSQRLVDADIMPRSLTPQFGIFDLDLIDERERRENLVRYYSLCLGSKGILVTIACFAPWGKAKKTNSYGKVIPCAHSQQRI